MKIFMIAVLACMLTVSCKKSSTDQRAVPGKWELRQSAGGFAGTINYEPGNGTVYVFDNNKGFQYLHAGSPVYSGTYSIKESAGSGDWLLELQYVSNSQTITEKDSIRFDSNKLIFLAAASCCDIPTISYERLPY